LAAEELAASAHQAAALAGPAPRLPRSALVLRPLALVLALPRQASVVEQQQEEEEEGLVGWGQGPRHRAALAWAREQRRRVASGQVLVAQGRDSELELAPRRPGLVAVLLVVASVVAWGQGHREASAWGRAQRRREPLARRRLVEGLEERQHQAWQAALERARARERVRRRLALEPEQG
jgi:sensor domain CHASE-containing protein